MPGGRPCAGCLGSGECWVCVGTGANDTERGIGLCRSCAGSRECRYCDSSQTRVERELLSPTG